MRIALTPQTGLNLYHTRRMELVGDDAIAKHHYSRPRLVIALANVQLRDGSIIQTCIRTTA
jgi:hypothetical protein